MSFRRTLLVAGLTALAAATLLMALLPEAGNGRPLFLAVAAAPIVALGALLVWRRAGALLAIPAGALCLLAGFGLGFLQGFSGQPAQWALAAVFYLALGVMGFAAIDALIVFGAPRRPVA